MPKILRITAMLLAALLILAAAALAANSCLIGTVTDLRDGRFLLVEVQNAGSYRFIDRMILGQSVEHARLYVKKTDGFHAGSLVLAFTSGGQEDSSPPGIRALFAVPLK